MDKRPSKTTWVCQVWNRYHGAWQTVKQTISNADDAKVWFFENPDKRRVLANGNIIYQPRD